MDDSQVIPYIQIAPVATSKVQFVSNFSITTKTDQVTPKYLVLNIAVDSGKTAVSYTHLTLPTIS